MVLALLLLQQTVQLTGLQFAGGVIVALNIAALIAIGFKIGRFEGRVQEKLARIEDVQKTVVSLETASGLRTDIARLEKEIEHLDGEKMSEHRMRNAMVPILAHFEERLDEKLEVRFRHLEAQINQQQRRPGP